MTTKLTINTPNFLSNNPNHGSPWQPLWLMTNWEGKILSKKCKKKNTWEEIEWWAKGLCYEQLRWPSVCLHGSGHLPAQTNFSNAPTMKATRTGCTVDPSWLMMSHAATAAPEVPGSEIPHTRWCRCLCPLERCHNNRIESPSSGMLVAPFHEDPQINQSRKDLLGLATASQNQPTSQCAGKHHTTGSGLQVTRCHPTVFWGIPSPPSPPSGCSPWHPRVLRTKTPLKLMGADCKWSGMRRANRDNWDAELDKKKDTGVPKVSLWASCSRKRKVIIIIIPN